MSRRVELEAVEEEAEEEEGFVEISEWFETLARAEKSQADRLQQALDALG